MARRRVLDGVSSDLKAAGQPPLNICLVLIVLSLAPDRQLRPVELEKRLEMAQYTMSRLLDRMEKGGLVRRRSCPFDGRCHYAQLTEEGLAAVEQIWPVYTAAVERHLGSNICAVTAEQLATLLDKIGRSPARA